jgi:hypothetical protein
MRTMGISPGDAVLVIEHRGAQQIVYNALVERISMRTSLVGTKGEPAIKASFVAPQPMEMTNGGDVAHATLSVSDIVHISHIDWLEGRAGLGYEEMPGPTPGVCRFCHCTERRPCAGGCAWLYPERTVCSALACETKWVEENKRRSAGGAP